MVGPAHPRARRRRAASSCPGYIDPHVHPAHADHARRPSRATCCPSGTTTVFADTLQIWELGGLARLPGGGADALARSPLKFYWMIRVHAQSRARRTSGGGSRVRDLARALDAPVGRGRRRGHALARRARRRPDLLTGWPSP